VKECGPRWTNIGRRLRRTAYVCRAAYKRYIDKHDCKNLTMPLLSDSKKPTGASASNDSPWNSEADEILKKKVLQYGRRWSSIGIYIFDGRSLYIYICESSFLFYYLISVAEDMGRSPEDVMLRYDFKIMRRKSGSWSREEDELLMKVHNIT
jgi:hypothetical protein